MMSQDNRLMPMPAVERGLDRPLSDIGQTRSYGPAATEPNQLRDYLFVVLKRKWLILSLCLVVTSLVAVQMFRQASIYEAEATIRIEQRTQNVLQTKDFVLNAQPDAKLLGHADQAPAKSGTRAPGGAEFGLATQSKFLRYPGAGRNLYRVATDGFG